MADKNTAPAPAGETVYTREELLAGSLAAFGVQPEMLAGAMRVAGKTEMTRTEAREAIDKFLKMEVK